MDPKKTETAVGKNVNHNRPYAANSEYFPGSETPITGCPAPRKVIANTGAAVDLIGARDLHNKHKQRKTSELTVLLKQILLSNTFHQPWAKT